MPLIKELMQREIVQKSDFRFPQWPIAMGVRRRASFVVR